MNHLTKFLLEDYFVLNGQRHKVKITFIKIDQSHYYYFCQVDGIHTMNIGFTETNDWINLTSGKTIYSKAIGELIETKYKHLIQHTRFSINA